MTALRADGGAAANGWLMQFQADQLGLAVEVAMEREMTAIGAAALAGLGVGIWRDTSELTAAWRCGARYEPSAGREQADALYLGWQAAVQRTV